MRLTASFRLIPLTDASSILMMKSPGFRPARNGRRVLDGRDHFHEAFFHPDFYAESAELALSTDLELLESVLVEVSEWGSSRSAFR